MKDFPMLNRVLSIFSLRLAYCSRAMDTRKRDHVKIYITFWTFYQFTLLISRCFQAIRGTLMPATVICTGIKFEIGRTVLQFRQESLHLSPSSLFHRLLLRSYPGIKYTENNTSVEAPMYFSVYYINYNLFYQYKISRNYD